MESSLSMLSSLKDDSPPPFIQPHYREAYRLAIYALLCGGKEAYREYLRAEQVHSFLSEEEICFILDNAKRLVLDDSEGERGPEEVNPSTYFPTLSDEEVPELELGWPEIRLQERETSISLLYHPPRRNTPTIKEVVRSQIQGARKVVAIAMDVFTDINIFKEVLHAALRGVAVYILLDDSQVSGFLQMSYNVGINILDVKNICVRTVRGPEYQCQSGMKFHGGLEQKFMLVDGRTVLYGTYSYSWSFEKINLSMVLVITGQLVSSFDEEFRRMYAHSVIPTALTPETAPVSLLRKAGRQNPASSQMSLNRIHSRGFTRGLQNGGLHDAGLLNRGLSVQERLHQSHYPDAEKLLRGHSYGGELQKLNSMTRLRMGTKDLGVPPDKLSQQHRRHQTRHGANQNLMPFNSESSLQRPFMENIGPSEGRHGAASPLMSPHGSHGGLNEFQSQWVHQRSREIWSKMEVDRQKRRSLQENFRQSQESLRSVRSSLDRPVYMSPTKGLDLRHSVTNLVPIPQTAQPTMDADGYRFASQHDMETAAESQLHSWNHPAALKPDADLLPPYGGLGVQQPRGKKSLFEIPEEKEGPSNHLNNPEGAVGEKNQELEGVKMAAPQETLPADPGWVRSGPELIQRTFYSAESAASGEGRKSPKSTSSCLMDEGLTEKKQEGRDVQRKNSTRTKAYLELQDHEKRSSDTEDKVSKGRGSLGTEFCLNPGLGPQISSSIRDKTCKKERSPGLSWSQHSLTLPSKLEKPKSPFSKRSSKRKTNLAAEPNQDWRSSLGGEEAPASQSKRERGHSHHQDLLSSRSSCSDKPTRRAEKTKGSSVSRQDAGLTPYQTDNKLGRFMQRVGHLITKHK